MTLTDPLSPPVPAHYKIRYLTRYEYNDKVELASHILHMTPRDLPFQQVGDSDIKISPSPTRMHGGRDHFGNSVHFLFFDWPHRALEVISTAEVIVTTPALPYAEATPPWEPIALGAMANWETADFLFASPMIALHPEATSYAAESFTPGRPILAGLLDLTQRIYRDFSYRPGSTNLNTPITDVLEKRCGVCQDFAHVMISGLRGLGLPARYVSGYIRNDKTAEQALLVGADHSHAWLECWTGPEHGWIGLDPTNGIAVQRDHVILAWGRDYCDVSPVRGIILGGGRHSLDVQVNMQLVSGA